MIWIKWCKIVWKINILMWLVSLALSACWLTVCCCCCCVFVCVRVQVSAQAQSRRPPLLRRRHLQQLQRRRADGDDHADGETNRGLWVRGTILTVSHSVTSSRLTPAAATCSFPVEPEGGSSLAVWRLWPSSAMHSTLHSNSVVFNLAWDCVRHANMNESFHHNAAGQDGRHYHVAPIPTASNVAARSFQYRRSTGTDVKSCGHIMRPIKLLPLSRA